MKQIHEQSLALVDVLFENMNDDEFLETYNALENDYGPLVSEFIGQPIINQFDVVVPNIAFELLFDKEVNYKNLNHVDNVEMDVTFPTAANDCTYSLAA